MTEKPNNSNLELEESSSLKSDGEILDNLLLNMDPPFLPTHGQGSPVIVQVSVFVIDVSKINEKDREFTVLFDLIQ